MHYLRINGGKKLSGSVKISGAKNAALPLIALSILSKNEVVIKNLPAVSDIHTLIQLLSNLGAKCEFLDANTAKIDPREINSTKAIYDIVRKMRASILVLGPLLARFRHCEVSLPGGCAIGARPIDLHLSALEKMGAEVKIEQGYVVCTAKKGLKGATINFDKITVTGTENIVMAAALASGTTHIINAAKEPEVIAVCNALKSAGIDIEGIGTNEILIKGSGGELLSLNGISIIPDRIEAGTFMVGAAMTQGNVYVENALSEHLKPLIAKLKEVGARVEEDIDGIRVIGTRPLKAVEIKTLPYPGFPTDMQAQFMALATICEGNSIVTETVFENRFMHVEEFKRMGAKIRIEGRSAFIEGVQHLAGGRVNATDLRAGAALVLAGLVAEGRTEIGSLHHIDRGYDDLVAKLQRLGADIVRVRVEDEE